MVRVAILWQTFPQFVSKCVQALAQEENAQLLVHYEGKGVFPDVLAQLRQRYPNVQVIQDDNPQRVIEAAMAFQPEVALIALTRRGLFARLASEWRKSGTLVIGACDHFWRGHWRDYANFLFSKFGGFSQYEAIFVPGAWGKIYARKLGFPKRAIFDKLNTCDTDIFQPIGRRRHAEQGATEWPRAFVFVGQYIPRKGIDILLQAYRTYRRQAVRPWELWMVGTGEMAKDLTHEEGVRNLGLKLSGEIAAIMGQAGCFVIPSRVDHWGVVIHEAACAGLPILASDMCGAVVELVKPGESGYIFPAQDAAALSRLLLRMDESGAAREMGKQSLLLSGQFSPQQWPQRVFFDIPLALRGKSLLNSRS